ncbi:MAG TPA: fibronectin type III domain-containing protein [Candidatus Angelobacter sp.]|nr:fibronectin type III domain-containing protein [Candidatus Angelobacter sp.]
MRPSGILASFARSKPVFRGNSAAVLFCLAVFIAFATFAANAQSTITPTTSTIQFAGTPAPSSITAPTGAQVLYGAALGPVANQPVRHLWVGDPTAGLCRMDPDLDSPGPYAINPGTCLIGFAIDGGAMALDPVNNLLYFVDNQRVSQGVFRINYLPAGDSGNGSLDRTSLFNLGGSPSGSTFPAGQTGCSFAGTQLFPNSAALDPEGNLWVGFGKASLILKFNNPGAVNSTNFGACSQFMQIVATIPNNRVGAGLAWMGHDLWGASPESVFVIPNADTVCLNGTNPACSSTNGTIKLTLPGIIGATALAGDQFYPAINGNNLYIGLPTDVAWVGNVTGGAAGQTLTLTYTNSSANPLSNVTALGLDGTDPANLVVYAGDDPSALGTTGAGRWFQTTQTSAAPGPPGTPLDVIAAGGGVLPTATVTWSPAQVAQPITSYMVHNSFASDSLLLPDVLVAPLGGGLFPPTSASINVAQNVAYQFQVSASNAQGSSPLSASSNVVPVGAAIPGAPTGVSAVAGDTQAYVSWTAPVNSNGAIVTSYTVTALVNGIPSGISSTIVAPATSSVNAIVSGLANGTAYSFSVHATSSAGNGQESAPSSPITPSASNVPVMKILVSGPPSQNPVPAIVSYEVTVTNTSLFPVTNVIVNNVLSTTDGAFIIVAEPPQGTCTASGAGVTTVACGLGNMAPGQVVVIDVAVQMQKAQITLTSRVTANDVAGSSTTFKEEHRTTSPPGTPPPPNAPQISVPISGNGVPTSLNPGQAGTLTWTVQNTTGVQANNLLLTMNIDSVLTITGVTASTNASGNPVTCNPPVPGLINTNLVICSIASLGGPKAAKPVTVMKVSVNVTAPNQPNLQLLPTGTVSFDGIDTSNPTSTITIRVH